MKRENLTKAMRWEIADRLAADRLPSINMTCCSVNPSSSFYARCGKRILDIVISLFALVITAPINLAIAAITLFDVGKPILFRQERVGLHGRLFTIVKFRNMRETRDVRGELLPADQRVTRFGSFVRKTSLDELLNFWSILKGDMSIIGPRPLVPEYTHRFSKRHKMRLSVRPGLECPPRNLEKGVWTWEDQFENDIWYVEHVSLKTDCLMLINLIRFAFDADSAAARASVKRGIFMGYSIEGKPITLDEVPQEYIDSVASGYVNKLSRQNQVSIPYEAGELDDELYA